MCAIYFISPACNWTTNDFARYVYTPCLLMQMKIIQHWVKYQDHPNRTKFTMIMYCMILITYKTLILIGCSKWITLRTISIALYPWYGTYAQQSFLQPWCTISIALGIHCKTMTTYLKVPFYFQNTIFMLEYNILYTFHIFPLKMWPINVC